MTAQNELGFIPMQLHVHGFYTNWFCHHEALGFLFKNSFTSCTHCGGEKAVWKMLIFTKMWLLAVGVAQQAKAHAMCVCAYVRECVLWLIPFHLSCHRTLSIKGNTI